MAQNSATGQDLSEVDQSFYALIKHRLNAIIRKPSQATVSKILNYSKSL